MFWIKLKKKKGHVTNPHRIMKGLRGKGLHDALDYTITRNRWPFVFKFGQTTYDMTIPFIIVVWCHYVGNMISKPLVASKAAQKVSLLYLLLYNYICHYNVYICCYHVQVLHYLLSQPAFVVKSWRARIYNYSSGTLLKIASAELQEWVDVDPGRRGRYLEKLRHGDVLFPLLGDAVVKFIKLKPQPFPSAMVSKKHFMRYHVWKRAMVALHMVRVVLKLPASKQWNMYNAGDYKWNIRFFRFWLKNDKKIMDASPLFQALPDDFGSPANSRKRKRSLASPMSSASEAPCTVFKVEDDSDDDEDSDSTS